MIYYRSIKFLKYALLSRHRLGYGIHSPFVFDLVSRVFRNKMDPDIVLNIEKIRKQLLSDKRSIYSQKFSGTSQIWNFTIQNGKGVWQNKYC